MARPTPSFVVLAALAELTTKAGEKLNEVHLQRIKDRYQLDGIDSAISGLDLRDPSLTAADALSESGLRHFFLFADGGQQFDESGVVVTGSG